MAPRRSLPVGISALRRAHLGDEAILQSIITQLRKDLPVEITVFSRDAEDTKRRTRRARGPGAQLSRPEVSAEVERLDLLILGGGASCTTPSATYLREVTIAKEKGVPVMLYAIGAGRSTIPRFRPRSANASSKWKSSRARAQRAAGARGSRVHREITSPRTRRCCSSRAAARGLLKHEGLEGRRRIIGVVRERAWRRRSRPPRLPRAPRQRRRLHGRSLRRRRGFVPMTLGARYAAQPRGDASICARSARPCSRASTPPADAVADGPLQLRRRHAAAFPVFAGAQGVPFVALPYAGKVSGFLED